MNNPAELINTPGWYYAIAYMLAVSAVIFNCPRRRDWKVILAVLMVSFGIVSFVMAKTGGASGFVFVLCMLGYVGMMIYDVYFCCDFTPLTAVYFGIRAFIIGELIASLEWIIYFSMIRFGHQVPSAALNVTVLLIVDAVLAAIVYFMEKRYAEANETFNAKRKEVLSAAGIALGAFTASNLMYAVASAAYLREFQIYVFLIRLLVDFGGASLLYAYHVAVCDLNTSLRNAQLKGLLLAQYQNYEVLQKSLDAVNRRYHDLKYQITILRTQAYSQETQNVLNGMEKSIRAYEAQNKTGNNVLDTILTAKTLYCQDHDIQLSCIADGKALSFMSDMDLSTLFGNALDNAIESVEKIEDKEKRLINLAVSRDRGFVRIRLENCCEEMPEFQNGLPKTTKKDKAYHGFGVQSIRDIAERYEGSVTMNAENGWFELRILLPDQER